MEQKKCVTDKIQQANWRDFTFEAKVTKHGTFFVVDR